MNSPFKWSNYTLIPFYPPISHLCTGDGKASFPIQTPFSKTNLALSISSLSLALSLSLCLSLSLSPCLSIPDNSLHVSPSRRISLCDR